MKCSWRRWGAVLGLSILGATGAPAQNVVNEGAMQAHVNRIMADVEALRGHKFTKPIDAENQSDTDFAAYVDRELDRQMPLTRFEHYGKVVKALGLYKGAEIADFRAMAKKVMTSQAAAYYDPATKKFFVLYPNLGEMALGTLYAHELMHGLQDQRFDLDKYMLNPERELNEDELFARQSVVEGEATLVMTLWQLEKGIGDVGVEVTPALIEQVIEAQSNMSLAQMNEMLNSGLVDKQQLGELSKAVDALDEIPPYMIEMLIGAYMKGMKFVYSLQRAGWDRVDELFQKPPASSEQILHPEKWIENDLPVRFVLKDAPAGSPLYGWDRLDSNTLGEMGFRSIFTEQGLEALGLDAAAGWDGDCYAVYMKRGAPDQLIVMMITEWDTEAEAGEFAFAYRRMLREKYGATPVRVEVKVDGRRVYISEGGSDEIGPALLEYMKTAEVVGETVGN